MPLLISFFILYLYLGGMEMVQVTPLRSTQHLLHNQNALLTLHASRRPREMYCGHARLSVCPRPHAYSIARTLM